MRRVVFGCGIAAVSLAAHAGETPLYLPPAAWVDVADIAKAEPLAKGPLVIQDIQVRAEGDTVSTYADFAMRIDSPQALTSLGTLTAQWMPDNGDLIVHRASLVREGAEIDLLKDARFTVLRREQQLEQRTLTGILTATMPVAGARVGDVLRMSVTTTLSDPALGGKLQEAIPMPFIPASPGVGRYRVTWPEGDAIRLSAGPRFDVPAIVSADGFNQVELPSVRSKPDDVPVDAPARFHLPPTLQLSSFADWSDVSATMAPLYSASRLLDDDGPIAAEAARIAGASPDPRLRAAAALKLVQDRIAYLAEGMNGGNYTPQTPNKTWETRYGDCKAKTLLLLALLDRLGIEAEPVLVNTGGGDGVFESLPMAAAFDHVLVRARVDGRDLWLDGTDLGSSPASVGDVPAIGWVLPLRTEGADLERVAASAPALPTLSIVNRIDLSAGIDFPAMFDLTVAYSGRMGAMLQQMSELPDTEQRDQVIDGMVSSIMGNSSVYERSLTFDAKAGIATVRAKGMGPSYFDRSGKRAEYAPRLLTGGLQFDGNRSRAAWRDIPVALPDADRRRAEITVSLPPLEGYLLDGANLHVDVGGGRVDRDARLEGTTLHVVEEVAFEVGRSHRRMSPPSARSMRRFHPTGFGCRPPATPPDRGARTVPVPRA